MTGIWRIMPSAATPVVRLRTTPPGPARRAVTGQQERWDTWETRGDQLARSGRIRAYFALSAAIVGIALYAWVG
jgi:hypothetical protein